MDYLKILKNLREKAPTEFETLKLLLEGKDYKEIAASVSGKANIDAIRRRTKRICTKFEISPTDKAKLIHLFFVKRPELGEWINNSGSSVANPKLSRLDYSNVEKIETIPYSQYEHKVGVGSVAVSTDSKLLAIGYWDGTVRLIETAIWKDKIGFNRDLKRHSDRISSVAFTPDGETLVTGSCDKKVKLWKIPAGELLDELADHTHFVEAIAISKDGDKLATVSWDKTAKIYKFGTKKQVKFLTEINAESEVMGVNFSPSSEEPIMALACNDGTVQLWNYHTAKRLDTHNNHKGKDNPNRAISVAFSPDSRLLASCGEDHTIKLCQWEKAEIVLFDFLNYEVDQRKENALIYCLAFSPDGRTLASGNWDGTVTLWDCNTADKIKQLNNDSGKVISVTFSPDGKLISGDESGMVKIWNPSLKSE